VTTDEARYTSEKAGPARSHTHPDNKSIGRYICIGPSLFGEGGPDLSFVTQKPIILLGFCFCSPAPPPPQRRIATSRAGKYPLRRRARSNQPPIARAGLGAQARRARGHGLLLVALAVVVRFQPQPGGRYGADQGAARTGLRAGVSRGQIPSNLPFSCCPFADG